LVRKVTSAIIMSQFWTIVILASFAVLLVLAELRNRQDATAQATQVCVFGSSDSVSNAVKAGKQLSSLPHWFVIWKEDVKDRQVSNVRLIPGVNTTHASAWRLAIEAIRSSGFECQYYFATDDDLVWTVTDVGRRHHRTSSLQQCLLEFLHSWRPAVTALWGDREISGLQEFSAADPGTLVQPATGFDNGALIFHSSIVDFFIPIWLGNDFQAAFTEQHSFLNMFIPFLFMSNAIRYNGIQYHNPALQRHNYDADANDKYRRHVSQNLKCAHRQWGYHLSPELVSWKAGVGSPPYFINVTEIAYFYNISDSGVLHHPWVRKMGWTSADIQRTEKEVNQAMLHNQLSPKLRPCVTVYDLKEMMCNKDRDSHCTSKLSLHE